MRVTTAFNRMLDIEGATVASVTFTPEGIVVGLRRRARRLTCPCGWSTRARYDTSWRRWRHLDLGACRLFLEAEIRRVHCRRCGRVRTEEVPWARPGARHSRDFEDVVAFMAQRVDKTTITRLLRCSWEAVAHIVGRVVAGHLAGRRLERLYRIGVDEVSYRKGHRYLTVIADHDNAGRVVWAKEGKTSETLMAFFDELGPDGVAQLQAISMDMSAAWTKAFRDHPELLGHIRRAFDPFHVVALANQAVDKTRRWLWNQFRSTGHGKAAWIKHTRWPLLKDPATLKASQRQVLEGLRRSGSVLWRAYQLKEALRDLYKLADPAAAATYLAWWLGWAARSRISAFVTLGRTFRSHLDGIAAAVELDFSNSKLEGLNSKVRLINHRGYGHHSAAALISMIYLCAGGITVTLPTER